MNDILFATAIVAVVEFVKRLFDKDYRAAVIIAAAGIAGGLAANYELVNLTIARGVVAGLGASGLVNVVEKVGKQK